MSSPRVAAFLLPFALVAACTTFKQQDSSATDAGPGDGPAAGDAPSSGDDAGGPEASASDGPSPSDTGSTTDTGSAPCDAATCPIETVVGGLNQATLVRVDQTNVYFGDEGTITGNVYQCPKSGCATPIPLGPGYATGLGVDTTTVYWNDFSGGQVVACTIGGCANQPTVLAPNQVQAEGVTFDGTNLFWATSGSVMTCLPPACSPRAAIATGMSTTIVQVASQNGVAYWVNSGSLVSCPVGGCGTSPTKITPAGGTSVVLKDGFGVLHQRQRRRLVPHHRGVPEPAHHRRVRRSLRHRHRRRGRLLARRFSTRSSSAAR